MVAIEVSPDFGYVLFVSLGLYLHQQLVQLFPVMKWRGKTGIKAPTLYPRDSEIKALKLSDGDVMQYLCAQRAHQNSVEFTSVFQGLFLALGLVAGDRTREVAMAGAVVLVFRFIGGFCYATMGSGKRGFGAPFHLGELYILYLTGRIAYDLIGMSV